MAKQDEIVWDFENYHTLSFYEELNLLENDKNKEKFIKIIEKYIRTSMEYRNYIKYLRTEANLNYCDLYDRLPEDVIKSLSIEMHHFPFTLYDLVEVVLQKYLKSNEVFTRLTIANEVMDLHYSNKVGLVPLTVTAHQLMHTTGYFVHKDDVFGNFKAFYDQYIDFMEPDHIGKITRLLTTSRETIDKSKKQFLEVRKEIFIEIDQNDYPFVNLPPPKEEGSDIKTSQEEETLDIKPAKKKTKRQSIVFEEVGDDEEVEVDQESTESKDNTRPPKTENNSKSLADQF
ncbi:hypothetical protein [Proteus mirabilis]|uniref:hypothetical protein n=1 Tax=Proteus mirabilis TaxID=584 RepID=UPI0034D3CC8F